MKSKDLQSCSGDFPSLQREVNEHKLIFLDGPGGTQVPEQVIDAISGYYQKSNSNTHGSFITSRETDQIIQKTRGKTAEFLGAQGPQCISFGANMTSLNFALSNALGRHFPKGSEVVITQLDHEANRGPWLKLRERGWVVNEVEMMPDGTLNFQDLKEKISERTAVVAIGYASNALGTINDIKSIRHLLPNSNAKLVVDAVHYAPHFIMDVQDLDCDFLLCSAYKFYGPHVGILYSKPGLLSELDTDCLITQEQQGPYSIETGTLNHAALEGVSAAIDYIAGYGSGQSYRERLVNAMQLISQHEYGLFRVLYEGLMQIPGVKIWGPEPEFEHHTPTISFTVDGKSAEKICGFLAQRNICAWNGHFYARRAIEMLGLLEQGGVTRLGLSMYTTQEDVNYTLEVLKELLPRPEMAS